MDTINATANCNGTSTLVTSTTQATVDKEQEDSWYTSVVKPILLIFSVCLIGFFLLIISRKFYLEKLQAPIIYNPQFCRANSRIIMSEQINTPNSLGNVAETALDAQPGLEAVNEQEDTDRGVSELTNCESRNSEDLFFTRSENQCFSNTPARAQRPKRHPSLGRLRNTNGMKTYSNIGRQKRAKKKKILLMASYMAVRRDKDLIAHQLRKNHISPCEAADCFEVSIESARRNIVHLSKNPSATSIAEVEEQADESADEFIGWKFNSGS